MKQSAKRVAIFYPNATMLSSFLAPSKRTKFALALAAGLLLAGHSGIAASRTWVNTTGTDFNTASSWNAAVVPGSGDTAQFTGAKVTNPNLSASLTIGQITFSTTASGFDLTSSSTSTKLTLGNATAIAALNTSNTNTIDAPIVLGAASGTQTISQASGGSLVINGVISQTGTPSGVVLTSTGNIKLTGTNTFTANTTISGAGGVTVSAIGNANASGNLGAGTTINLGNATTSTGVLNYIGGGETTTKVINLSGTTGGGTIDTTSATGGLIISQDLTATGAGSKTLTLQGNTAGNAFNGKIVDNSSTNTTAVTKAGTGAWALGGANTFTGGVNLNGGTLYINNNSALGSGTFAINGSSVAIDNNSGLGVTTSGLTTIDDSASGTAGDFTYGGTNALNLGSAAFNMNLGNGAVRNITLNGNGLTLGAVTAGNAHSAVGITVNGSGKTLNINSLVINSSGTNSSNKVTFDGSANVTVTGVVSQGPSTGGSLAYQGSGTLTLQGANTYVGSTTLTAGTVQVAATENAGTSGPLGKSGTINLNGGTLQYSSANTYDYSSRFSTAASQAYNIDTNGQNVTYATTLSSSGGTLTKSGLGKLTLSLGNTYTGATTINGGTLYLSGPGGSTAAASTVAVNSGGTLAGTGTVNGAVNLNSGGAINLQDGAIGTLNTGALTIGTGTSALSFDIGAGSSGNLDKLAVTGALTLTGSATINIGFVSGTPSLTNGTYTLISYTGTSLTTAQFNQLSLGSTTLGSYTLSLVNGGNTNGVELQVSGGLPPTATYSLTTTAAASRLMLGQSTGLTTTIKNTAGSGADTLNYTGLGATSAGGTIANATKNGGPLSTGASDSNTAQTFTGTTAGAQSISGTVATATNGTSGNGNASLSGTTPATVNVLNNRTESGTSVALGRVIVNQTTGSQTTTITSTTGQDAALTRTTLGAGSQAATVTNGTVTLASGTSYQFGNTNDATNSTTRGITGNFSATGNQSGTASFTPTGEGLTGESVNSFGVNYTADAVANRTESATSVALGRLFIGHATGSQTTTISSATGQDAYLTRVTLGSGSQAATVTNGTVTLATGTSYQFGNLNDATNSTNRNVTGTFTATGNQSGTASFTPTGEGLTGESVQPIGVNYTADAVNYRSESSASVSLGRTLWNAVSGQSGTLSGSTTISSVTGQDAFYTRTSLPVGNVTTTSTTISLNSATGYTFGGANDAVNSTTATLSGFWTTGPGLKTQTISFTPVAEGLAGELATSEKFNVSYTANVVALRTISNGAPTNFGTLHSGASVSGTASAFSSTGTDASTTRVQVAGGNGSADSNGVTLTGSSTTYSGDTTGNALNGSTQTFGGTITNATGGTTTGSFNLAATTLESGLGDTYSPVTVGYTATVFTGKSTWNTAASGAWGTITGTTPDSDFTGNWTANGGAPGVTTGFNGVDTATFGAQSSSAITVGLNNAAPNLNKITFSSPSTSYTLAQNQGSGSGSNSITLSGTAPSINVTGSATVGTQTISAPIFLGSNTSVNVGTNQTLNLNGVISDPGESMTYTGPGTTIVTADNLYTGGTTITGGTTYINNAGGASYTAPTSSANRTTTPANSAGSGTGTGGVTVGTGAANSGTLAGSGTIKSTSGGVTVNNGGTLASGGIQTGTTAGAGLTVNNAANLSNALTVNSGATLTFALGSTTNGSDGSTFNNPNTNSSFLSLTGTTTDLIFATPGANGSDTINLVDLTAGSATLTLTLRYQNPYLLVQTDLGNNADFANLLTSGGLGQNGFVTGVSDGLGHLTSFNLNMLDISGNNITTSANYGGLQLYLNNGDLEVVPEPGTWAMMLGGLALLILLERRRTKG